MHFTLYQFNRWTFGYFRGRTAIVRFYALSNDEDPRNIHKWTKMAHSSSGVVAGNNFSIGRSSEEQLAIKISCIESFFYWSSFQPVGNCSMKCGGGVIDYVRKCIGGSIGDQGCQGPERQTRLCNTDNCGLVNYCL